ncbi:hypothetical protein BsWGS_21426 [Bradybaena similaris]
MSRDGVSLFTSRVTVTGQALISGMYQPERYKYRPGVQLPLLIGSALRPFISTRAVASVDEWRARLVSVCRDS